MMHPPRCWWEDKKDWQQNAIPPQWHPPMPILLVSYQAARFCWQEMVVCRCRWWWWCGCRWCISPPLSARLQAAPPLRLLGTLPLSQLHRALLPCVFSCADFAATFARDQENGKNTRNSSSCLHESHCNWHWLLWGKWMQSQVFLNPSGMLRKLLLIWSL